VRRLFLTVPVIFFLAAGGLAAPPAVFHVTAQWRGAAPPPDTSAVATVRITVDDGWHINSNAPLDPYLIPTSVRLDAPDGWHVGPPAFPEHTLASLSFSDQLVAVFEGSFAVTVPVRAPAGAAMPTVLRGAVEAQACNDTICLAPQSVAFTLPIEAGTVPPPSTSAASTGGNAPPGPGAPGVVGAVTAPAPLESYQGEDLAARFARSGFLLQLAIVFLAGLALNLTPCVYPLIPITVGFFMAQKTRSRAGTWLLALSYVIGMAVTYSALGVVAALTGRLFGTALQSPWVVGGIVVLLVVLALSMFGLWEVRVPAWATRASGGRSGVLGAVVMGLVVGLVAAPCIGPFVLGLLTYVGQRQDVVLGLVLFFTLSLGLGLPYLFLAVFTRSLERLPRSGAWMNGVQQLFGVLLVALAVYFLTPFLGDLWSAAMMAAVLVLGGLYLLVLVRPGHEQPAVDRFMRLASAAVLVAGILLLPKGSVATAPEQSWKAYDAGEVGAAMDSGRTVIIDFYADWCIPCKELDTKTFSAPVVAERLGRLARFKVDLTSSTTETEALRNRYHVAGVPTIIFLRDGEEVPGTRLTGFEPPAQFLRRLERATGT
jgi:thiol:disulfide interchange protein DsbD